MGLLTLPLKHTYCMDGPTYLAIKTCILHEWASVARIKPFQLDRQHGHGWFPSAPRSTTAGFFLFEGTTCILIWKSGMDINAGIEIDGRIMREIRAHLVLTIEIISSKWYTMTPTHGKTFQIVGPLWGGPAVTGGSPYKWSVMPSD